MWVVVAVPNAYITRKKSNAVMRSAWVCLSIETDKYLSSHLVKSKRNLYKCCCIIMMNREV